MSDASQTGGATGGEDVSELLLTHLTTRELRNVVELEEIDRAYDKHIFRAHRKKSTRGWLSADYIREVHADMFAAVWGWAGKFRQVDLNIGCAWHAIPEQIRLLCDDFVLWSSSSGDMPPLEVAARLQNRLTRIHPFKNGNGRHARLITDIYFHSIGHKLPVWPQIQRLPQGDEIRREYIAAMKKADSEDYRDLKGFISGLLPK